MDYLPLHEGSIYRCSVSQLLFVYPVDNLREDCDRLITNIFTDC